MKKITELKIGRRGVFGLIAFVILAIFLSVAIFAQQTKAVGITKYARTAGGNWSSASTWSTTSGGGADTTVPTAEDDVVFDANSGNVTIDAAAVARSVTASAYGADKALTHNAAITLSIGDASGGALNFSGSWTYTKGSTTTSAISFVSTSNNGGAGWNITWGGHTPGNLTFNGVGGKWVFQDGYTAASTTLYLTAGELNTNGQAVSVSVFYPSNSASAILTLGASSMTAYTWNYNQNAGWTFNCGTSTVTVTGGGFYTGGKTYYSVVLSSAGEVMVIGSGTYTNFTRTGTAVKTDSLTLNTANQTVTGTLTLTGNSAVNRLLVKSGTLGTARTFTAAVADIDNVDFMDITGAGAAAPFTGISIGNAGGNSQITPDAPAAQTWSGSSGGNWSENAWSGRVPLPQDDVSFNGVNFSSGQTVTADMPRLGKSISWTGATHAGTKPTWQMITSGRNTIYGSLTLISDMTFTYSQYITFQGRGAYTLTTAGKSFTSNTTFAPVNGTLTLLDNFLSNASTYFTNGTFDANGHNVTVYSWSASAGATTNLGSGTWTMTGSTGGWSGGSVVASTSTIAITGTGITYFGGGTGVFNNITIAPSAGVTTFSGAFTFANMTMSSAGTKTVKFTKSTTYTMTGSNFLNGTNGNLVTVDSDDGATQWTLNKTSGVVASDYVAMNRSNATGGAGFFLGANSTMAGSTGWVIDNTPPINPTTFEGYDTSGKAVHLVSDNFYHYPNPYFEWDGATDAQSQIAGYYLYFGTSCGEGGANPQIARGVLSDTGGGIHFQTEVNATVPDLTTNEGIYCFRMKIRDNAGNVSAVYEAFIYKYDMTAPSPPAYIAASPSGYTATNNFSFSWPAAADTGGAGIAGYQYRQGNNIEWSATQTERTISGIQAYQEGTNIFLVRTVDNAGNISADVQTSYYYTTQAPTKPTSLAVSPESSSTNSFTFDWIAPVHARTITDYGYSVNAYPTTGNINWTGSAATTLGPDAYATQQGTNTFYLVAKDEAGNYALDVANVATVNFSCTTSAPPAPSNATITDTSNRAASLFSLTLKWSAGSGQDPSSFDHYSIERSINGVSFSETTTTASTAYIDTNLSSLTTYYYRVKAVDNAGQVSAASNTVSKIPTGNYTSPPALVGAPDVSAKATTATITWVTERRANSFVRYAKEESQLQTSTAESKGQIETVTEHSVQITGLSASTKYFYQVQSYDENRDYETSAAYSTPHDFTTQELPAIKEFTISNITTSTADLSFETTVSSNVQINYGTSLSYGASKGESASSFVTRHAVKLENLPDGTAHHVKVTGQDQDENSFTSDDYVFTTIEKPYISNLGYQQETGGPSPALSISWHTNVPTSSTVEHRPKDGQIMSEKSASDFVTDHKVVISGLNDDTLYTAYVSGRDQFGNFVQSDEYIVKTAYDTRAAVILDLTIETSNIGTSNQDRAQMVVSWKTDEPTTSQVEYGEGIGGRDYPNKTVPDKNLVGNHLVVLGNLNPQTPYHLRVVSLDKANNTSFSKDYTAIPGDVPRTLLNLVLQTLQKFFGWAMAFI